MACASSWAPTPISFVDGSGGGDAFNAGYIVGLLEGRSELDCLKLASAVGASCVRSVGTTAGVFTRAEAEDFVRRTRSRSSRSVDRGRAGSIGWEREIASTDLPTGRLMLRTSRCATRRDQCCATCVLAILCGLCPPALVQGDDWVPPPISQVRLASGRVVDYAIHFDRNSLDDSVRVRDGLIALTSSGALLRFALPGFRLVRERVDDEITCIGPGRGMRCSLASQMGGFAA